MDNAQNSSDDPFRKIATLLLESSQADAFSDEKRRELNKLLRANEENRAFAAQYLLDSESLRELLSADEIKAISTGKAPKPAPSRKLISFSHWTQPLIACAAVIALGLFFAFGFLNRAPIALVQDEANAVFANGILPIDGQLEKRSYSLVSGMISVEFRNGVSMTVKAPADFEVVDEFRVRLSRGNIRAFAPESGHGFVIETPDVDIQDLGTEFGVSVDGESGNSDVHVFEGRVDVKNTDNETILKSLELGDSAHIMNGQVNPGNAPRAGRFPTPSDVTYNRWSAFSETIRQDKDVVFYHGFSEQTQNPQQLLDEAQHGDPIHGIINGARWVSGRWPHKRALLFDQQGDSVQLNISEEFTELTFAAWVNIDRFDEALTAIMNTIGWQEGSMHLQIPRSNLFFAPAVYQRIWREKSGIKVPTGRWTLLTAVINTKTGQASSWINGKQAVQSHFAATKSITPGNAIIGSWKENEAAPLERGLRGRIDELILWRRALTEPEIKALFKNGRPRIRTDS